ncbi:MAG: dihydrofolate reductase [Chloroflexi bacterium]|jgi:dihydrofolate reductase|nr:dihydrofolate reductase [Chloroflexota bacterium]
MTSSEKPPIALVAALDEAGVIGYEGGVPWRLPADMRWFRERTMGKPVIMGRRTYESIGRPLPGRHNIVVTRRPDYEAPGCEVVHSPAAALEAAAALQPEEIAVIGGATLYAALLPQASRLYLTCVDGRFPGDTFFPDFDRREWRVAAMTAHPADERHSVPFRMVVLERRGAPAPWPAVVNG